MLFFLDVPWIFVIWGIGGFCNHLVSRVWCSSTLLIHTALLGYSIAPTIPFAAIILFLRPPVWIATIMEIGKVIELWIIEKIIIDIDFVK